MNSARGIVLPLLLSAATLTIAGLLWVNLASRMAETGLRINELVTERQTLLQDRAAARLRHAAATNPRLLASKARAMGFDHAQQVESMTVRFPHSDDAVAGVHDNDALSLAVRPEEIPEPSANRSDAWPRLSLPGRVVQP